MCTSFCISPLKSVSECIILKKLGMCSFVIVCSLLHSNFISINYVQQLFCLLFMQMLVRTLHTCSVKFPDVAVSIVPLVSVHFVMTGNLNHSRQLPIPIASCLIFVKKKIGYTGNNNDNCY